MTKYVIRRRGGMCRYWDGADCPCKIYGTGKSCPNNADGACFKIRRVKVKPRPTKGEGKGER